MTAPFLPRVGAALAAGAVAGVLGSCAQQYVVGPARLPVGVLLAVLLLGAVAVAVQAGARTRWGGTALAVGWFAVVTTASSRRREGDVLVPGDTRGWAFLLAGTAVLGLAVALPLRPPARRPTAAR